ncbi:hypothetical protein PIB30_080165, partial [Stylosanthes scabra]|nr:hypothetical protein [Stylosanthes scabra]
MRSEPHLMTRGTGGPPSAHHAYCIRHMGANFMARFRNTRGKDLMTNAAYSASLKGAKHYLQCLEAHLVDMHAWALSFRKD